MGLAGLWLPTASKDSFPQLFARPHRRIAGAWVPGWSPGSASNRRRDDAV